MLEEKGTLIGKYKGYLIYVLTHDLDSLLAGQFFSPTLFSSNNRLVIVESLATLKRKIDEAKFREIGITGYLPYPVLRIEDKTTMVG